MNLDEVTRLEVIDETGRILVLYDIKVEFSLQDNNRTFKILTKRVKRNVG